MNFKNVVVGLALVPALIACGSEKSVEAPAPVVESAPVEVVETPAPVVEEVSPVIEGDFTTTSHWADAPDTSNSGTATYNPETNTVTWYTSAFGVTDQDSCTGTEHNTGLDCSISYDANGNPTRVVVTDDYDGYRISTTTFKF